MVRLEYPQGKANHASEDCLTKPLPREELLSRQLQRAQIENSQLRASNKKLLRSGGLNVEGVVDELRELITEEAPYKSFVTDAIERPTPRKVPAVSEKHVEIAALAWSDWHISEKVRLEDSNNINSYDSLIASARVGQVVDKQKKIIRLHECMYPISKIWVPVLGDMINGSIHEELRLTNDLSDPAATVLCARLMILGLEDLASLGLPIEVDCVIGNHPRMTAKMPTKAQAQTSYDWLIYSMVEDHFARSKQVKINVHTGQLAIVNILGWRWVLEHGIDWHNGREEDAEDAVRALFDDPIYRAATGLTGASFDQIVIGNLHKPAFLERTIKNGSLTGQNELGMSWRLKPIKAQQLMWGISKSHVRTWQYQIDVTNIREAKGSNPYIDYTRDFMKRHGRGSI